jgi:hypothetical protein
MHDPNRARRLLLIAGGLVLLGSCWGCGLVTGLLFGEAGAYQRRYEEERKQVEPVLESDPAFAGVELLGQSGGTLVLGGRVKSEADRDRLRAALVRVLGEKRADEATWAIQVPR